MQRRTYIQTAASIGLTTLAGCGAGSERPAFEEGFERGIGDWEAAAAIGPEVELDEFDWDVDVRDTQAHSGSRSLRIWNEGTYDDGTTWVTHPVPVESGAAYTATATAQIWSESESFNTLRDAVMRLGPSPPSIEEAFPQPGVNTTALGETPYGGLREPLWLADGWREYRFEWTTPTLASETLHLSLGTSVIWEGQAEHYIDDVTVELQPR